MIPASALVNSPHSYHCELEGDEEFQNTQSAKTSPSQISKSHFKTGNGFLHYPFALLYNCIYRIIQDAYRLKHQSFVENIRGYDE